MHRTRTPRGPTPRTHNPAQPADETYFEWTCLPTLASDILYVDDYNRGAPPKGVS